MLQHDYTQQAHGPYGVDEMSAFSLPVQHLEALLATTQPYVSNSYNPSVTLSSLEQQSGDSVTNGQYRLAAAKIPAASMGPPARPRKRKAPTLRADAWEQCEGRILELHITQKLPLPEVKKKIKEETGFDATLRQYRTRISQWNQDKNVKPEEMQAIVRKRQRRKLIETNKRELIFNVRGNHVPPQKIERWMKRHDVAGSFLYSPISAASTPSALGCHTISDRGSPALISMNSPAASMSMSGAFNYVVPNPQVASPALSVSSLVHHQGSDFTGQSPALAYRSLSIHHFSSSFPIPSTDEQMSVDTRPRYKQDEEQQLRERIAMAQISIGTTPLENLGNLRNLGWVLIEQGRYRKAECVARDLLVQSRSHQSDGSDKDVHTLRALELLGHVLKGQGMYIQAERLLRHVLRGNEKVLGPEHPATLASIGNLGLVLEKLERYVEAAEKHREVLGRNTKVFGPGHTNTLTSISNLASVLVKTGSHEEAKAHFEESFEGFKKQLGTEHPYTLASMDNLGTALERLGRYEEAEAMFRQALEGSIKVLGPEHPETIISISNLGMVLERMGLHEEAEAKRRQALQAREKVLGSKHPSTLDSICALALLLEARGKFMEAEEVRQRGRKEWGTPTHLEREAHLPAPATLIN
ncbi:hypothetical protein ST47_g5538 [Ascochyta rabiei]|uniref:Clr5 domain-containing protein n=2 Tax=Didymella rabiei TaxID=5454 RepID=A0A163DSM1_DIDRA|nr:hypothetical protein ST47_g5538 [Ascochyta rabiei]